MAGSTNFGWQFLGTILCGFIFALPIVIGYYLVKFVIGRVEKGKEKREKEQTVI
ncbi:MAG: hypothetical protein HZR80_17195 [Candidatus Heimdallarchaeota archaeon]